jgi:hypothetical protein
VIDPESNEARLAAHVRLHNLCLPPHPEVAACTRQAEAVREAARVAIAHLIRVLNGCRTADEQQQADTEARDWLRSIGAE